MLTLFDQALQAALRHAGEAANEPAPLRRFLVTIGTRQHARLRFEAMAPDSCAVVSQHAGLLAHGERIDVKAIPAPFSEEWFALVDQAQERIKKAQGWHRLNDAAALRDQQRMEDHGGVR